jgi:ATP-dependent exoDNAse (exonuclease V) beta subunit
VPLRIVNPSSVAADPASPSPAIARPVIPPAALGPSPFGCADEEGTAFHRAVQLWSYRGECTPDLVARAVRTTCGDARLGDRSARLAALVAMQRTTQPALVAELEAAAARGDVHHEVAVGYVREDGAWVEGSIDLLYRGADGAWHVVDYKTSQVPDEAKLRAKIAEHHGQVRAYAEAIGGRVPGPVGSYALWFVSGGVVARWVAA